MLANIKHSTVYPLKISFHFKLTEVQILITDMPFWQHNNYSVKITPKYTVLWFGLLRLWLACHMSQCGMWTTLVVCCLLLSFPT